jgi:hypothetical protein
MASRRSVLIGLGGLVAGGGAILGTGAFTSVSAERTVNVQTTGDASGFLGLEAAARPDDTGTAPGNTTQDPNENEYVTQTGETIQINLDGNSEGASGLNQDAVTTFRDLVRITNNGTQDVTSITLSISSADGSISANTFEYTVNDGNVRSTVSDGSNILGAGNGQGDSTTTALTPGEPINFGMVIDLIDGSLPESDTDFTLTITAETGNTQGGQ